MDLLNSSLRVGRIFGINVRVHVLFLLYAAFRLWQERGDLGFAAAFLGLLFGIVLLHEFGHCFGARAVGGFAENILMWPLGGLAFAQAPMRPWPQFVTVAAGPLVNVLFCVISGTVLVVSAGTVQVLSPNPFASVRFELLPVGVASWMVYLAIFYAVNYLLLAFNLLPVYPLDGGQLLQCVLWPFVGLQRAMTIACQIGLAGCIALGLWGLAGGGGMLIFIALFGGFTCWQRLQALKYGLIVDESFARAPYREYRPRRSRLSRLFARSRPTEDRPGTQPEAHRAAPLEQTEVDLEVEVDRILKKVHERGLQSLSYVERQTLVRATRERQRRERQSGQNTRV